MRVLSERGFLNQTTDLAGLNELSQKPLTAYIGFDLTARSLHVGSLIQIMVLRWLEKMGHEPLVLLGEATTRIGDPTGKTTSRPMLSAAEIVANREGIKKVFERMVRYPLFVSNEAWLNNETSLFSYLQDFGSHFTVNRMVAFDSVKARLEAQQPMSFLEFNYMLFQSIDFLQLFERMNVRLQIGGSDQWGNIVNGVDLVRRKTGEQVFGLTTPLMTNSAGDKMGKTADGAVWLDPDLTSPSAFWQFWRNVEDSKVEEFLGLFTDFSMDEVRRLGKLRGSEINVAKKILANEVTRVVHGHAAACEAENNAKAMFGAGNAVGTPALTVLLSGGPISAAELFVTASLVTSKGDADRLAKGGGMRVNGELIADARKLLNLKAGTTIQIAAGKKRLVLVRIEDQ